MTAADLLVLHSLRCIGFAGLERVAEAAGLAQPDTESELIDLAVAGLVTKTSGAFGGWGLTEAGRTADAERISAELDAAGARVPVSVAYEEFLELNPELLDLCSAWQLRSEEGVVTPNDHADAGYDALVLDRLADLDRRVGVVCADLSALLPRFQRYRVRLTAALTRARAGELDFVTNDLASYHSVWFQLHEDLLVTLGIPR
ncbi:transcriptional regulator [Actinophytocola sp.]|uniref:transcriptional regulator n=1 Tax=Actinophytocola sp. TaxID=1872138 RepID=UPI002D7E3327|nr:transcriptional regulator [Actinophytocola sp.]HET9140872.1 transcriptional regulator [Actinophytocola sp.]